MTLEAIDNLAWIHVQDKKLLTVRSKGKELFYIPGGKREQGESDEAALIREVKEELTVDISPESLVFLGTFSAQADGKAEGVPVKMRCYTAEYSGNISKAAEIAEVKWLNHGEKGQTAPAATKIMNWLKLKELID